MLPEHMKRDSESSTRGVFVEAKFATGVPSGRQKAVDKFSQLHSVPFALLMVRRPYSERPWRGHLCRRQ